MKDFMGRNLTLVVVVVDSRGRKGIIACSQRVCIELLVSENRRRQIDPQLRCRLGPRRVAAMESSAVRERREDSEASRDRS